MADKKNRVFKPSRETVRLKESLLPEIKDLEVGEVTTITLKVRMTSKSQGDEYGGSIDGDDDWEEREYGKEYAEARRKDRSQLRGSFEILEADEDGQDNKSGAEKVADRIMAGKRRKRIV